MVIKLPKTQRPMPSMSPHLILPTFFVTWFITMFFVLPLGLKAPDKENPHHYAAAPTGYNLKRKCLWNTLLAAVVTLIIHVVCLFWVVEV